MGHDHHHHHHHHPSNGSNLKLAFGLNLLFTCIEIYGGLKVNSIAIISDAWHDLGDTIALGLAWYLHNKAFQKSDKLYTFGYNRFSLLGAFINSLILISGSIFILINVVQRIISPEMPDSKGMFLLSILGILFNGVAAFVLFRGTSKNEKVAYLHLLEDVLGWAAVLIGSIVIYFFEIPWIDPLLSLLITFYIMVQVVRRLKEVIEIFMQKVPVGKEINKINEQISSIENVKSVHHTHIWSLDEEHLVFTVHIVVKNINDLVQLNLIKEQVKEIARNHDIYHATIDIELENETCFMKGHSH